MSSTLPSFHIGFLFLLLFCNISGYSFSLDIIMHTLTHLFSPTTPPCPTPIAGDETYYFVSCFSRIRVVCLILIAKWGKGRWWWGCRFGQQTKVTWRGAKTFCVIFPFQNERICSRDLYHQHFYNIWWGCSCHCCCCRCYCYCEPPLCCCCYLPLCFLRRYDVSMIDTHAHTAASFSVNNRNKSKRTRTHTALHCHNGICH